jgi:hypothetical protein
MREVAVHDEDGFGRLMEYRSGQAQVLFQRAFFGDVAAGTNHTDGAAFIIPRHHPTVILYPNPVPATVTHAVLHVVERGAFTQVLDDGFLTMR